MSQADLPTVCVIIPTLNRATFLEETLGYLVQTEYPHDRLSIFIVGDPIDTETPGVVERFRPQTDIAIRFDVPEGLRNSGARNYAIRNTTAEVIVFLDDDCITHASWIHELVRPLAEGRADITGGTDRSPGDDPFLARCEDVAFGSLIGSGGVRSSREGTLLEFCPATCNMAMFRARAEELGGFDESIRVAEDTEFAYKARRAGFRTLAIPEALVLHRRRAFVNAICYHNYIRGYARLWLYRRYPHHSEALFLLPGVALLVAVLLLAAGFAWRPAWWVLGLGSAAYAAMLLVVGIQGWVRVRHPGALFLVPVLTALHHFWYAVGILHAPLTGYRKVYYSYQVNVSDPFGRKRKTAAEHSD